MTTSQIKDEVKQRIQANWKAISTDGSAFDSSQFRSLQRIVDDGFWDMMEPTVMKILEYNLNLFPFCSNKPLDVIHGALMKALKKGDNLFFVYVPGINSPRWPDHVRR